MGRLRWIHILYAFLVVVFFVLGTIGYRQTGISWENSSFYALQLYVMNYFVPEKENILIYITRLVCPIMTATGLLSVMRGFFKVLGDNIVSRMKEATAVYYDDCQKAEFFKHFNRVILAGTKLNKRVKSHILMFSTDMENLAFYAGMEDKIKNGSKVYLKLEDIDSKLLDKSELYYFNIYEIIARMYWKERNLIKYMKDGKLNVRIAMIGFDTIGKKILDYGLMNNIYSTHQSIQYHVWGDSELYRNLLGDFDRMNGDEIVYHEKSWEEEIEQLKEFDRIIVTETFRIDLIQALLHLHSDAEIDYYNPSGIGFAEIYMGEKLSSFGEMSKVITEKNIKTDWLYRLAKKVNYEYTIQYDDTGIHSWAQPDVEMKMQEAWEKLNGFKKGSNVACADYHEIRLMVMKAFGINKDAMSYEQEEMLAEMEHIRWSRYHYVNHWHYADVRNDDKRLHHLLKPYAELPEQEKKKDKDAFRVLLKDELRDDW